VLGCALLARATFGEDWPFWRGPSRQGISQEKGLPTQLLYATSVDSA